MAFQLGESFFRYPISTKMSFSFGLACMAFRFGRGCPKGSFNVVEVSQMSSRPSPSVSSTGTLITTAPHDRQSNDVRFLWSTDVVTESVTLVESGMVNVVLSHAGSPAGPRVPENGLTAIGLSLNNSRSPKFGWP